MSGDLRGQYRQYCAPQAAQEALNILIDLAKHKAYRYHLYYILLVCATCTVCPGLTGAFKESTFGKKRDLRLPIQLPQRPDPQKLCGGEQLCHCCACLMWSIGAMMALVAKLTNEVDVWQWSLVLVGFSALMCTCQIIAMVADDPQKCMRIVMTYVMIIMCLAGLLQEAEKILSVLESTSHEKIESAMEFETVSFLSTFMELGSLGNTETFFPKLIAGCALGFIFGYLDNWGLKYGGDALEETFALCMHGEKGENEHFPGSLMRDNNFQSGLHCGCLNPCLPWAANTKSGVAMTTSGCGNTFSDLLGVFMGSMVEKIIKSALGVGDSPWWFDSVSTTLGCAVAVVVPWFVSEENQEAKDTFEADEPPNYVAFNTEGFRTYVKKTVSKAEKELTDNPDLARRAAYDYCANDDDFDIEDFETDDKVNHNRALVWVLQNTKGKYEKWEKGKKVVDNTTGWCQFFPKQTNEDKDESDEDANNFPQWITTQLNKFVTKVEGELKVTDIEVRERIRAAAFEARHDETLLQELEDYKEERDGLMAALVYQFVKNLKVTEETEEVVTV